MRLAVSALVCAVWAVQFAAICAAMVVPVLWILGVIE
jgi:hypothetical protein